MWYVQKGLPAAGGCCKAPPPPLSSYVELQIKAPGATDFEASHLNCVIKLDRGLRGLIVLNLQSYGGGRDLWGGGKGVLL
eukprot:18048-Heterococcus_DN1.PRE.1